MFRLLRSNNEHLREWIDWIPSTPTFHSTLSLLQGWEASFAQVEHLQYAVCSAESSIPVGSVGLHPGKAPDRLELSYWLDEAHQGKGYIAEATAALSTLAFHVRKVRRLDIRCAVANVRSQKVARSLGFRDAGTHDGVVLFVRTEPPARSTSVQAWDRAGSEIF